MKTESDYMLLFREIQAIERKLQDQGHGWIYLADENVDAENVDVPRDHPEFWTHMYCMCCSSAGYRAEGAGFDINVLIGRIIY